MLTVDVLLPPTEFGRGVGMSTSTSFVAGRLFEVILSLLDGGPVGFSSPEEESPEEESLEEESLEESFSDDSWVV